MPGYIERVVNMTIPLIPMRDVVAFPGIPINFELSRRKSVNSCTAAISEPEMKLFLVMQRDSSVDNPAASDLYVNGAVVRVKQTLKNPDGNLRVIAEGMCRAKMTELIDDGDKLTASVICKYFTYSNENDLRVEALMRGVLRRTEELLAYVPAVTGDFIMAARAVKSPDLLADLVAATSLVKPENRQRILDIYDPRERLETLLVLMEEELELLRMEVAINRKVHTRLERNQREYYLREQLRVIENELDPESESESAEYQAKIDAVCRAGIPEEVETKLRKEASRLDKLPFGSPESGVLRNYLDVCLEIPWTKTTNDRLDIGAARKILDADHDGLEKVKERVLEFLAVKQFNPDIKNQIICLVGPPGTGKTSIGISIARALKRKLARVSLGGVRDEADIRGHRKTYIGAMPGRIITALTQCGSRNPVILLDEIDKMCRDMHGDPSSALLEVLDSEQNKTFRDHFIELPVDLSECMFITTANTLSTVPRPLLDRMEVIELHTYTRLEKLSIAKNHLIPKQLKRHGLNKRRLKITDAAVLGIIDGYTSEAGVRNLERELASVMRKAAVRLCENDGKRVNVDAGELPDYLGAVKFEPEKIAVSDETGVVNGLAYTEVGGDLLKIEASVMDGGGKLELTGTLGDVMKESARIALSYIRAHAAQLGIDGDFYKNKDIHIHVPEGAVPKEGPSAGVTILTALVSVLSSTPVRRDIAMTGEITLTGRVLPIGGLREKSAAAYAAGIRTILIPEDNVKDIAELDAELRCEVNFIACPRVGDVLNNSLTNKVKYSNTAIESDGDSDAEATVCRSAPRPERIKPDGAAEPAVPAVIPDGVPAYDTAVTTA